MTSDRPSDITAPTRCPFCFSAAISAAGKKLSAETYWRCDACSQLWHPDRLRSTAPTRYERPYR